MRKTDKSVVKKSSAKILQQNLIDSVSQIKSWFYQGDWDEHFSSSQSACPELLAAKQIADPWYYRCNKNFLECVLRSKKGLVKKGKKYSVKAVKKSDSYTRTISKSFLNQKRVPSNAVEIELTIPETGHSLSFSLENDCQNTYLPKRIYSYFRSPNKVEVLGPEHQYLWDNFNSNIFIDKFQVRWRDIADWMQVDNKVSIQSFPKSVNQYHEPATSLTQQQMERYCSFRGKQLLPSHYFDAATVLPGDKKNSKDFYTKHYYYPWTIRKQESFVEQFSKGELQEFSFEKKHCQKVYSKECINKYPLSDWIAGFSSWTELRQVMGGPVEFLPNILLPRQNLKASSYLFPLSSAWHRLGLRSFWDRGRVIWDYPEGKRGRVKNLSPLDNAEVNIAFRCMKYSR